MNRRLLVVSSTVVAAVAAWLAVTATTAAANPVLLPTMQKEAQLQRQIWENHVFAPVGKLQPPAPPCPENGMLPSPFSSCGLPEFPATTLPYPGNMSYYGGRVQVHPAEYLVFWGWGEKGAWPSGDKCTAETITEGTLTATLPCDPNGAGKYTANWVYQLGDTQWSGEASQYYQTVDDPAGNPFNEYIDTASPHWLKGIWVDDTDNITGIERTSGSNPAGPTNTYTDLAAEAARAYKHFGVTDRADANFIIFQPANYSDPNALSTGYCAFHDYIYPGVEGGIYDSKYTYGVEDTQYTNLPYLLSINSSGVNECGEDAVNPAPKGTDDGFSIALGHEIIETATDPGAEDVLGSGTSVKYLGGWYDPLDANEIGDKCAWVGENLVTGQAPVTPIPGAMGDIKGNERETFAVQSLWSNQAAEGAGYCAGAGTDLPQPVPSQ